jgi:hypothetical protein
MVAGRNDWEGDATLRGGEICSWNPSYISSCWKAIYLYISGISLSTVFCIVEFEASNVKQNKPCRIFKEITCFAGHCMK